MKYLLDTNICINFLNGRSEKIKKKLESTNPANILMCSVVKAELFFGSLKSKNPERNLEKQRMFVSRFHSLPFDDNSAEIYGRIRADLEKKGKPIGPNDLLIAAISIAHKTMLVTHNTGEFSRVDEIELEDWEL